LAIFGCKKWIATKWIEIDQDCLRIRTAISRVLWALAQISCFITNYSICALESSAMATSNCNYLARDEGWYVRQAIIYDWRFVSINRRIDKRVTVMLFYTLHAQTIALVIDVWGQLLRNLRRHFFRSYFTRSLLRIHVRIRGSSQSFLASTC